MNLRFALSVVLVCLLSSCSDSDDATMSQGSSTDTESEQSKVASAPLWKGDAKGYVSSGSPDTDIVAHLVAVGTVTAHLDAYKDAAQGREINNLGSDEIVAAINDELWQAYRSIEQKVLNETSQTRSLEEDINRLTSPEYVTALDAGPRERLPEWDSLNTRFKYWLEGAVTGVKGRTITSILFAQSALLRKAGYAFQKGIDSKSNTVDEVQEHLGYGFLHAALDMSRLSIQYCDAQRDALKAVREGAYELRGKLAEKTAGVGDMYDLAAKAEKLASGLTGDDGC